MHLSPRLHRRLHLGIPAMLLGLCLVFSVVIAPLTIFHCLPMDMGFSLEPHHCCMKKDKAPAFQAEKNGCCERIKEATSPAQAFLSSPDLQPDRPTLSVPILTLLSIRIEGRSLDQALPISRGPPARAPAAPVFLLNASFLC